MKNLVICGNCENQGTKSVLGEITPEGYFAIMRFHMGFTNIVGRDFAVVCGNCHETQYIRKESIGTEIIREAQLTYKFNFGTI